MIVDKSFEIIKLKKITDKFLKIKIIQKNGNVFNSKFYFFYYFLSLDLNLNFRNILVDSMEKAEKNFPGSSLLLCKKIVKKYYRKNTEQSFNKRKSSIKDLDYYFLKNFDKKSVDIFMNILKLGGPDVSIKTIPSLNNNIDVSFKNYSEFNLDIDNNIGNFLFNDKKTIDNKRFNILLTDTFIEKDSEIYKAIEISKKNKSRLIIVSRGYSTDFYRNLKEIMLKNNTVVYPYICKFNDKDPFKLSDLGEILDINVISPDKGENINTFCEDYIKEFNDLSLERNNIKIKKINKISSSLKESINIKTDDKDLKEYLSLRKRRLSSKTCLVSIPNKNHKLLKEFNIMIKVYNEICKHGMTENNIPYKLEFVTEKLSKLLVDQIKKIGVIIKDEK